VTTLVRRVRTPEGVRRYRLPIGAPIVAKPVDPASLTDRRALLARAVRLVDESSPPERVARAAYSWRDPVTGLRTVIDHLAPLPLGTGDHDVLLRGRIVNQRGNTIGTFERRLVSDLGLRTAVHDQLMLDNQYQGQGFAARWNAHVEAVLAAAGYDRIKLLADMTVGGYAWARAGWDWDEYPDSLVEHLHRTFDADDAALEAAFPGAGRRIPQLRRQLGELVDRFLEDDGRIAPEERWPTPWEVSELGRDMTWVTDRGVTLWPGKSLLIHGPSWKAVKDLGPLVEEARRLRERT
jgi:hypothetical protein